MYKVFVGNITPEGDRILSSYLDKYMPDAEISQLQPRNARIVLKTQGASPEVCMIIIDESLYDQCVSVAKNILDLPKTHLYKNDDGLKQFLISKFGELDAELNKTGRGISTVVTAPDFNMVSEETLSSIDELNRTIESLESQLAQEKMLNRNLSQRLDDGVEDVSEYVTRIRELSDKLRQKETELAEAHKDDYEAIGKITKAEQVLADVDSLKAQIKELGETKSKLEFEKSKLESSISELTDELGAHKEKISNLNGEISNLKQKLSEYSNLEETVSTKDTEISNLQSKVSELDIIRDEIEKKNAELEELRGSSVRVNELLSTVEALEAKCSDLEGQVSKLKDDLKSANQTYEETQSELLLKNERLDSASEAVEQLRQLQTEYDEKVTQLNSKTAEVESLNNLVSEKTREINRLNNELLICKDAEEINKTAVTTANNAKADMENRVITLESEKAQLQLTIDSLQKEIDDYKLQIMNLDSKNAHLLEEIESYKNAASGVSDIESELLEERRNVSRLKAENEVLKQSAADASKAMELKIEVTRLTSELERVKRVSGVPSEEYDSLKRELEQLKSVPKEDTSALHTEIAELRKRCTSLELDLASTNDASSAISDSVFGSFYDNSANNVEFRVKLPLEFWAPSKPQFACICAGTSESYAGMYSCIRNFVMRNPKMRIVLVDMVSDSKVDQVFGVAQANHPTEWLFRGGAPTSYFSNGSSHYPNLKVITTGFKYFNDVSLLTIDWSKKLKDLAGIQCDLIIFNVGILTSPVTRVLFNTFKDYMRAHIVTIGTPENLRTTSYMACSFGDKNFCINCINFNIRASKQHYEKMAEMYNCRILDEKDTIQFM